MVIFNIYRAYLSSFTRHKAPKSGWPWLWPFTVTQGQCECVIGFPIYGFLVIVNSIWPVWAPLRDIRPLKLGDLDFDLSKSLKVKSNGAVGTPIYDILLMYKVTICFSLTVMATIGTRITMPPPLPTYTHTPLPWGDVVFFFNTEWFPALHKMKLSGSIFLRGIIFWTRTQTDRQTDRNTNKPGPAKLRQGLISISINNSANNYYSEYVDVSDLLMNMYQGLTIP